MACVLFGRPPSNKECEFFGQIPHWWSPHAILSPQPYQSVHPPNRLDNHQPQPFAFSCVVSCCRSVSISMPYTYVTIPNELHFQGFSHDRQQPNPQYVVFWLPALCPSIFFLLVITLVQILHGGKGSTLRRNPNIFGSLLGNQSEGFPKPFRGGEIMPIKQCCSVSWQPLFLCFSRERWIWWASHLKQKQPTSVGDRCPTVRNKLIYALSHSCALSIGQPSCLARWLLVGILEAFV